METMRADRSRFGATEHPIDEYLRLRRETTMLQARCAEVLGRIDREDLFADAGYLSTIALVRDRTGDSWDAARRCVSEARGLADHSCVRDAFASAAIDRPRVAMLLAAAKVAPELFARDERVLVDTVASLSMGKAFRVVEYWRQAADREAAAADAEHLQRRRRLHLSPTLGGMVRLDGELDPEGGEIVITALRSLTDPGNLDPSDPRTGAQRRADALVELCADHLAHGDTPIAGGVRPQITLTVSPAVLRGEPGDPSELAEGTVVLPETARRIACDAVVTRVATDGSGVLDVGRATRIIPSAIRKALITRDRGCTHPGCGRPHRWCDAHHVIHWADGGPTRLSNLVLLCRRHHRMRHEGAQPQRE